MPTTNKAEELRRQQEAETALLARGVYLVKRLEFNGRCLVRTADDTTLLLNWDHYVRLRGLTKLGILMLYDDTHLDSPPIGVVR